MINMLQYNQIVIHNTDFPILKMKARAQLKLGVFGIHSYLVVYISCDKNLLHKIMIIKVSLI